MDPNNKNIDLIDFLVKLFYVTDNLVNEINKQNDKIKIIKKRKRGVKPNLSTSELITLAIFRYFFRFNEWKKYHAYILTYHKKDFPKLTNYPNFLIQIQKAKKKLANRLAFFGSGKELENF